MNEHFLIHKENLNSLLKLVMKDFCLISPQPANNGDFLFQDTKELEKININYDTTSNTLKEFFFPARDKIFDYQKEKNSIKIMPVRKELIKKTVFFGIRSCDIRAVYFQDLFFGQEPKDNLYWQKRDNSILISIACNKPPSQNCFCIRTHNAGPVLEKGDGFDLQFIDLDKIYLVEIGTIKGQKLIEKYKRFFTLANKRTQDKKSRLKKSCLAHFPKDRVYDIMNIYNRLKNTNLKDLWEELGKRCTNCGGCEFICPTCFCFYTQDIEYSRDKGERIRAWDSCAFCSYSRMAGEINPHEENADRVSRRFFCKLHNCYNWFKVFACTGCGRCSFVCPVNLDMESFISSLIRLDKYQPLLKEL